MSNVTDLLETDRVDFILTIDNGNDPHMRELEEEKGIKTIFVDTFYEFSPECRAKNYTLLDESKCYGRSMIDVVQRIEELAIFLGVDVDVPKTEAAKRDACAAAAAFSASMKDAHAKDMRIKVSILGTTEYPADSGTNVPYARDFDPITLWVPRTLEELGAPLLHGGTYDKTAGEKRDIVVDKFFLDCDDGLVNATCKDNTYHPVDFWLIDSRSYLVLEDWVNFDLFPDPVRCLRSSRLSFVHFPLIMHNPHWSVSPVGHLGGPVQLLPSQRRGAQLQDDCKSLEHVQRQDLLGCQSVQVQSRRVHTSRS